MSNTDVPSTVVRNVHNELRRALILEVLQTRQEVVLQVRERVAREAAEREHARLRVVEQEELHHARATRLRVRRALLGRERDVDLRGRVEHDVHQVPVLLRGGRHRRLAELVRGVHDEGALARRAGVVVVGAVRARLRDAVLRAVGRGVGEVPARAAGEARPVGELRGHQSSIGRARSGRRTRTVTVSICVLLRRWIVRLTESDKGRDCCANWPRL